MYDKKDFFERLVKLRKDRNVSQREMSLGMGQSAGYMKQIENKSSFPAMTKFFNICDYLEIHPKDFFDDEIDSPQIVRDINNDLKQMSQEQLTHIAAVIKDMIK